MLNAWVNEKNFAIGLCNRNIFFSLKNFSVEALTWLLYTHATDSGNSRDYLASFYSKCFNGNGGRMMRDLVQVCFIEGDRSLAHLFARFLAVLLK